METNKKVYGVYFSKAEAEDAVRRLMDLGYSTDELVLEEETKITILIDSDREIIDSAVLDEELDNLNPEEKQSRIMKRIEKFNKIKGKETEKTNPSLNKFFRNFSSFSLFNSLSIMFPKL